MNLSRVLSVFLNIKRPNASQYGYRLVRPMRNVRLTKMNPDKPRCFRQALPILRDLI
jgi:hypothetical protein